MGENVLPAFVDGTKDTTNPPSPSINLRILICQATIDLVLSFPTSSRNKRRYDSATWHSDIQFETCPADYTSLRLTLLPADGGGDTLWASGYELYDRFSKPYQKFLEGLTATFMGDGFLRAVAQDPENVILYDKPRGSPLNVGKDLTAVHPVVRTNPVTGWKSIFALGGFPKRINELEETESRELLDKFYRLILDNHDLTVRFRWRNKNDIGKSISHVKHLKKIYVADLISSFFSSQYSDLGQQECVPHGYLRLRRRAVRAQSGWDRGEAVFRPEQQVENRGLGGAEGVVELIY